MYATDYASPFGKLLIVSDGEAITGIWFYGQKHFKSTIDEELVFKEGLPIFNKALAWLDCYFRGLNPKIDFKLRPHGSEFRLKVWKILCEIPHGETMTYGDIARRISPTMSAQAVGGAVGANPISIMIPCHRVLGRNGELTGYAAGIDRKKELLQLENCCF